VTVPVRSARPRVALVHDYFTQRGGAERVALAMHDAFPGAPVFTSLHDPAGTFPEVAALAPHTSRINRVSVLRRNHRLALPLLAPAFAGMRVDADCVLCSSSGWAHGVATEAPVVVYCHTPARWLYQSHRYLPSARSTGDAAPGRRASVQAVALAALRAPLTRWDTRAAHRAVRYLANSRVTRDHVALAYGIEAEVLPPPVCLPPVAPRAVAGVDPGYVLCVSRLVPHKNVGAVVSAFARLPHLQLVVVGSGPQEHALRRAAGPNVTVLGRCDDAQLRWLYEHCTALVAASHEDFGLTPLEAAASGKPSAVLRGGGFLDTVDEHATGVFFDQPTPGDVADALRAVTSAEWDPARLRSQAARFGPDRFAARLHAVVDEVVAGR
jgi:glycosyltransferase involved in cell wall biosynthesis